VPLILAGDVGGTKSTLALYDAAAGGASATLREATLPSREFRAFEDVVRRFLGNGTAEPIAAACFGVAGPVIDGHCSTTNLPWELSERDLAARIPARQVKLLNDLEATGEGVLVLPPSLLLTLQPGAPRPGNMAVIAAGTGLGEAVLVWDGARHRVVASEGGHADFAPRTDVEMDLLRYLRREFGHVSYERVLSGPGLHSIYRFLRDTSGMPEPEWLAERLRAGDPSSVISEAGLDDGHPLCVTALDLFVSIYGAEAGNLALKVLATGGVSVAGGIGPKIHRKLEDGLFIAAFRDKGRFAELMTSIPVHLVLAPDAALRGAARVAADLL
jgi:glucokinase